jgi:hypothetical protein
VGEFAFMEKKVMRVTGEFSTGMIARTQLFAGSLVDCFKRSEYLNQCIDDKCSGNFSQDLLGIIKSIECSGKVVKSYFS